MDRLPSPRHGSTQPKDASHSGELVPPRLAGEPRSTGLAWTLWRELKDIAWQELHHPLIRGLAHGTLSKDTFEEFIAQDRHYPAAASKVYSQALSKASSEGPTVFAMVREMLEDSHEELSLHAHYTEDLDWEEEAEKDDRNEANKHFEYYMMALVEGPKSLVHTIAAMWVGVRMWSFMACQIAEALPDSSHEYREWILTYASEDYLELPAKHEHLIDTLGPVQPYEELRTVVREAATLNLMFLSDLAGLDPLPPVCALVTSFEACAEDRAASPDGAAEPGGHPAAGPPASPSSVTAGVLEQRRLRTEELMATLRTEARREGFQPEAVASLRSQSELIDRKFLEELMVPGQDEHAAALQAASTVVLRPGVVRSLRRTLALRIPAHVVSRCHPHSQAAGDLAAAGLRVHGSPDAASVSPSQTPTSKSGQPTARVIVHGADGAEGSLARLNSGQEWPSSSGSPSWRADMAARGVGSGPRAAGMSVYVGTILADVQPMLSADLGILVDPDPDVIEALGLLGVRVDVLTAVPTDPADRAPRTLYHAHGWSEVEAFLFGSPQRFNLYRTTTAVEILSSQSSITRVVRPSEIEICKRPDGTDWQLGYGTFGEVYKGLRGRVQDVAVKCMPHRMASRQALARLRDEVQVMEAVSFDRNIVQYYGAWLEQDDAPFLVMEYMEGGDLRQALTDDADGKFAWARHGKQVAVDVARGLHFLHASGVEHGDLKTSNVLLTAEGVAKISDVRVATGLGAEERLSDATPRGFSYAPTRRPDGKGTPGTIMRDSAFDFNDLGSSRRFFGKRSQRDGQREAALFGKADIYSFGLVLWELLTRETPENTQLRELDTPAECPEAISQLISDCMHPKPDRRPGSEEVFSRIQAA